MFSLPFTFYATTATYLISHFLIQILSATFRIPNLHSDWLCWSFLLLTAKLFTRPFKDDDHHDATAQSDKLALAIAAVCAFRIIGGVDWALVRPCISPVFPPTDLIRFSATTHAVVAPRRAPSF